VSFNINLATLLDSENDALSVAGEEPSLSNVLRVISSDAVVVVSSIIGDYFVNESKVPFRIKSLECKVRILGSSLIPFISESFDDFRNFIKVCIFLEVKLNDLPSNSGSCL